MAEGMNVGGIYSEFEIRTSDAERRIAEIKREMDALRAKTSETGQSVTAIESDFRSLASEAHRLEQAMRKAGAGAETIRLEPAAKGMRNFGQAALETSRAVEDFQYGIGGVVNNIPSLVMSLGGSAGLTAVISLAAVAIAQLVKHWDDVLDAFGRTSPIRSAADELEKLRKQSVKTAEDFERIATLEGRAGLAEKLEQAGGGRSSREFRSGVERALLDDPEVRDAAIAAVERQRNPDGVGRTAWQMTRGNTAWFGDAGKADFAEAERRAIREQVARATESPEQLASLVGLLRESGQDGVANRLETAGLGLRMPGGDEFGPTRREMEEGAAARAEARRKDEEQVEDENRANAERYRQQQDAEAKRLAANMQGRFDLTTLGGGAFDVVGGLRDQGLGDGDAKAIELRVLDQLAKTQADAVAARAAEQGVGAEAARESLFLERRQAAGDAAVREAEARDPSVRARAERYATMSILGGGLDGEKFQREIAKSLIGSGLGGEQADLAARRIAAEAGISGMEFAGGLGGGEMPRPRGVDQFDARSLLERVQAGVGSQDVPKQQLETLKTIADRMKSLVEKEQAADVTRLS